MSLIIANFQTNKPKQTKHGPRSIQKLINVTGFKADLNVDNTNLKFNWYVLDVEVWSGLVIAYRKYSIFSKSLSAWTALETCFRISGLCSYPAYLNGTCMKCTFTSQMQMFGFPFSWWCKIHGSHIVTIFFFYWVFFNSSNFLISLCSSLKFWWLLEEDFEQNLSHVELK